MSNERRIIKRLSLKEKLLALLEINSNEPTYYEILGVGSDAELNEIKKAYYTKSQENHPDKGGNSDEMAKITKAYRILSSTILRESYDITLKLNQGGIPEGPIRDELEGRLEILTVLSAAELEQNQEGKKIDFEINQTTGEISKSLMKIINHDEKLKYLTYQYTHFEQFKADMEKFFDKLSELNYQKKISRDLNLIIPEEFNQAILFRKGENPLDSEIKSGVLYFYYKVDDLQLYVAYSNSGGEVFSNPLEQLQQEKVEDLFFINNFIQDKTVINQLASIIFKKSGFKNKPESDSKITIPVEEFTNLFKSIPPEHPDWLLQKTDKWPIFAKKNPIFYKVLEAASVQLWPGICKLAKLKNIDFAAFPKTIMKIADKKHNFKQIRDTIFVIESIAHLISNSNGFWESFMWLQQNRPGMYLRQFFKFMTDINPIIINQCTPYQLQFVGQNLSNVDFGRVELEKILLSIAPKNWCYFSKLFEPLYHNALENEIGSLLDWPKEKQAQIPEKILLSFRIIPSHLWVNFSEMLGNFGIIGSIEASQKGKLIAELFNCFVFPTLKKESGSNEQDKDLLNTFNSVACHFAHNTPSFLNELLRGMQGRYPKEHFPALERLLINPIITTDRQNSDETLGQKRKVSESGSNKRRENLHDEGTQWNPSLLVESISRFFSENRDSVNTAIQELKKNL